MKTALALAAFFAAVGAAEAKTVKVSSFGYDPTDSTAFIRAAIESDADEIVFDRVDGQWYADTLSFRSISNKTIRLEKGVELRAKHGAFHDPKSGTCLMSFWQCSDITLSGYGAAFRMERDIYDKPPYVHSEHRHCLNLRGVRNFRVEGLTFAESGGDGIFIGGSWRDKRFVNSENVYLTNVVCDRNYRQGLSIIAVSNFVAKGCVFSNTKGTPPESGVDIEPNQSCEFLSRIGFQNCRFENNAGRGLEFYIGNLNSSTPPVTAMLDRCTMIGNINGFEYQQNRGRYPDLPRGGLVVLRDCTIERSTHAGILLIDKPAESAKLVFENVKLVDCCVTSTNSPDVAAYTRLADTPPTDGVTFRNLTITRPRERPWITPGRIDYTSTGAKRVDGTVRVTTAGATKDVVLDADWRATFAPQPKDGPTKPRVTSFDRHKVRVADPAPGEMRPLEDVVLAGTHRVVFFVESVREVKFRAKHVKLSAKRPISMKRMLVCEYTGSKCCYLQTPDSDGEFEISFNPKRAGYYTLDVGAGKQGFTFTAANVPVGTEIRDRSVRFGMTNTGALHFAAAADFSLFAAADSYEKAKVRLLDPSGAAVWEHSLLVDRQRYQGRGADGLWSLELRRPKGIHRTVDVDLTGVSAVLFLSGERYWSGGSVSAKPLPEAGLCGHQGNCAAFPGNTAEGIADAIRLGVAMVEFDAQRCKSGEFVLMHDSTIDALTTGSGRISDHALEELKSFRIRHGGGKYRLATLDEALDVIPKGGVWINLHCYCGRANIGDLARHIRDRGRLHQTCFCANLKDIEAARKAVPELIANNIQRPGPRNRDWTPEECRKFVDDSIAHKCRFLQLCRPWPREYSDACHAAGIKVIHFKCDDPAELPDLKARGIDFVMTNHPEKMGTYP